MSSNHSRLHPILLYAVGILAVYQQYCIYNLQTEVAALQDHFKMYLTTTSASAVGSSAVAAVNIPMKPAEPVEVEPVKKVSRSTLQKGVYDPLNTKSPPPKVPHFEVLANDTRSKGGKEEKGKEIYGGVGDEVHLGGFTELDKHTVSHNLWNFMLSEVAVKSVIDIGCGRGISTNYFRERGAKVLCVEGSHDAIKHSYLPKSDIVQHDYSKGPWWPEQTFDVAWSTELVEHIGRQYHPNYFATMKKAAIVMFTSSGWGGYHHVEIHDHYWWLSRMQANGFLYSRELTEFLRDQVINREISGSILGGIKVFINPAVASLPQHRHLFGGHGCYHGVIDNRDGGAPCTGADELPLEFQSLINCNKHYVTEGNYSVSSWVCEPNPKLAKGKKLLRA